MRRDEQDDALDVGDPEAIASIHPPLAQAIEPEAPVGIDHDLDHVGIGERAGDSWSQGAAQHGPVPLTGFVVLVHHHSSLPSSGVCLRLRWPLASCRATWSTNLWYRSRPIAFAVSSFSG